MGVSLTDILEPKEIALENLSGKTIAVDSFNWIYQFLTIIRQPDGQPLMDSQGRVTSHLSGLFYRTLKMVELGIRPVYVFDGKPPEFKSAAADKRRDVRAEALAEWKEALKKEDYESARKYASRSATIDETMVSDSKELLHALGVPVVQAPNEGEALCSLMTRSDDAFAAATQDYDALLFACPRIVRNLSITGRRRRGSDYITINPELVILEDVLESLGINQTQLILLGILVGTDYNLGGVPGFGPKKALARVKEKKTLKNVFDDLPWSFEVTPEEIFEFFKKPQAMEYKLKFNEADETATKRILCGQHDFSVERVDNALAKLAESKKAQQNSLRKWF